MRLLRVGEIPAAEENCLGVHPLVGRMRGARRLVFVFSSGGNFISGTSNGGSERQKSLQQSKDFEWGNIPTAESFDFRRLIKKGLVGKSALQFSSGENPISGA